MSFFSYGSHLGIRCDRPGRLKAGRWSHAEDSKNSPQVLDFSASTMPEQL
ncbi:MULTISPECIES: hypothetical protein [unclassified Nostoc]|nr:hypothetical protein [Nostoc sp. 'Peltigera membranacea cyanobiont' 213]